MMKYQSHVEFHAIPMRILHFDQKWIDRTFDH